MVTTKAIIRAIFITVLLGSASAADAQRATTAQRCTDRNAIGWLGISSLSCTNCVFTAPGRGEPILFSTEPRINTVASGSPAEDALRPGDVLVSIDGMFITTHAGGTRFNNLKPGDDVTVVVRRNGEQFTERLEDLPPICPNDSRVPGHNVSPGEYASGARAGGARAGGRIQGQYVDRPPVPVRPAEPTPAPAPPAQAMRSMTRRGPMPRASFGFSFECSACTGRMSSDDEAVVAWEFSSPPVVYAVEPNSEAARQSVRRGDILTHIDGVSLTSREGGQRFGAVKPGESVVFRIRRGSEVLTRTLRAQRPSVVDVAVVARTSETSLQQARQMIEELQRQEDLQRAQLDRIRRTESAEVRALTEQLRKQQIEQETQLHALQEELARADRELRAMVATTPRPEAYVGTPGGGRLGVGARTGPQQVRYVSRIGDTDIEVRGGANVQVEEDANGDIIIRIGGSEIKLKRVRREQ
jgi:hypothetical protein